jgi:Na+/H+-dicarboxylate symporter
MKKVVCSLTFWVLVGALAGAAAALGFGSDAMREAKEAHLFYGTVLLMKTAFVRLLFMLVAPIVFFSLLEGIINLGERAAMSRLGGVTVSYYLVTTAIAIAIGLVAVLFIHPWTRQAPAAPAAQTESVAGAEAGAASSDSRADGYQRKAPKKLIEKKGSSPAAILKKFFLGMLTNPFEALASRNILAIVFNAFLIGVAVLWFLPGDSPLRQCIRDLNLVFQKILGWAILTAPVGVFAIVFDFKLSVEGALFTQLAGFCLLVFGATMLHGLVVLPLIAWLVGGVPPWRLFAAIGQPLLVALSTASSAATLPVTMNACRENLDADDSATSFVCPLGATVNMDGTALFEGIAAVFLAYLFDIQLGTPGVIAIFTMAMVSSVGAPGMPSGSMSGMQMVLLAAGIPLEAIGILLVVERPLDTFRTAVNVEGDIIGALVVSRFLRRGSTDDGAAAQATG